MGDGHKDRAGDNGKGRADANLERVDGKIPSSRDGDLSASAKGSGSESGPQAGFGREREKTYAPPSKPLSPQQLGRIAQSFGIVVPSLPSSSPSSSSTAYPTPPRSRSITPVSSLPRTSPRPSSQLITVIPPLSLLPPSTSDNAAETLQRWKRGRLIPLQPSLGAMLLAIAREYGLPSTQGIGIYLVATHSGASTSPSTDNHELGPKVSSQTWGSLCSSALAPPRSSLSTPSGSPSHKFANRLPKDHPQFPPSPFSLLSHNQRQARPSDSRQLITSALRTPTKASSSSSLSSSSSSPQHPPLTPASLDIPPPATFNPIIGTIEFDVDPYEATWFPDWIKKSSRHRRKPSTLSDGGSGIKELRLVAQAGDDRPRFLKDTDRSASNSAAASLGYAQRSRSDGNGSFSAISTSTSTSGEQSSDRLSELFPETDFESHKGISKSGRDAEPFTLRDAPTSRRYSIKTIDGMEPYPLSTSASLSFTADSSLDIQTPALEVDEVVGFGEDNGTSAREGPGEGEDSLLAPFSLKDELGRSPRFLDAAGVAGAEAGDKRGSGVVMSEQLDDLERREHYFLPSIHHTMLPQLPEGASNLDQD